jgi:hypothetical protein
VIEICGGLLLVVGLLTRLTALALAADMLGAIAVSGLARWETVSLTLAPVLLAAMIILTRFGAGDWSLDRHLAANMSRRCAACLLIFSGSPSIRTSADVGRRIERMRRVTWADVTVAWPWRVTTGLAGLGLAGGLGLEGEVEELSVVRAGQGRAAWPAGRPGRAVTATSQPSRRDWSWHLPWSPCRFRPAWPRNV